MSDTPPTTDAPISLLAYYESWDGQDDRHLKTLAHRDGLNFSDCIQVGTSVSMRWNHKTVAYGCSGILVGRVIPPVSGNYGPDGRRPCIPYAVIAVRHDVHHTIMTIKQLDKFIAACITTRDRLQREAEAA